MGALWERMWRELGFEGGTGAPLKLLRVSLSWNKRPAQFQQPPSEAFANSGVLQVGRRATKWPRLRAKPFVGIEVNLLFLIKVLQ